MDLTAPHLGFVAGAYGASVIVLAALALWIGRRDARARSDLREAERRRDRSR